MSQLTFAKQGSVLLSSQQALSTLSNQGMCSMYLVIISGVACFIISLPRTLDRLAWMGLLSAAVITLAGFIAMVGAGVNPVPGRTLTVAASSNFYDAFLAVTNPVCTLFHVRILRRYLFPHQVFAYAGKMFLRN